MSTNSSPKALDAVLTSTRTNPDSAKAGWDRTGVAILGAVTVAVLAEVWARYLRTEAVNRPAISQCVSLVGIFVLLAPALYLILRMHGARLLKSCIVSATALAALSQFLNFSATVTFFDWWPIFSKASSWHSSVRSFSMVVGLVLLLASVYLALLETIRARQRALEGSAALEREIEERKRTEAKLRESEDRYRLIFDGSQEGIVFLGADGKRGMFNHRLAQICGYTPDELDTVPSLSTIHPDDIGRIRENNRRRIHGEAFERTYEFRLIHRDGHAIDVEGTFDVVKRDDVVIGVCGIIRDISQRKRTETELAQIRTYARCLMWVADVEYRDGKLYWLVSIPDLEAAQRYLPLDLKPGQTYFLALALSREEFQEDARRIDDDAFQAILGGQESFHHEFRCRRNDGEIRWIFEDAHIDPIAPNRWHVTGISTDITERKRIEASLQEAQERYQALFERSLDALYISDFEGRFVDANPAALALLGYERSEITSLTYASIIEPEGLPIAFQQLAEIGAGTIQREVTEFRLRRKDGAVVYVETNASLLYRGTTAYGVLGVARDITERKLSEDKIRKLADILDTAPSAITVRQYDGTIIYANKRASEIHRYTEQEFATLNIQSIVAPGGVSLVTCREELLAGQDEAFFETRHFRKDGSVLPLDVFVKKVDWFGEPALLSIATDITERLLAEAARRITESRYRRLFESAKDGILILDAVTGRIVDANPYIEKLLGYSPREFVGLELWEIGVFKDIAASKEAFEELRSKEYFRYEDLPLQHKNGSEIAVEFVSNLYLVEDTQVIQCNIRDVSERKHLERQLRQAQKMEAVGQLAGGVAHDFNNLLQVILGNLDFAMEEQGPDSKSAPTLDEVRRAAERAADLTRQLLAFSRQQIMQPVNIDIGDVIQGVLKMLRRVIGEHIELCFIPRDNDGVVCVDKGQIEQVLMNLCVNARDAMPGGGRLTIETENAVVDDAYCVEHPWASKGRYVVVSVSDTGEGMDTATLSHLFEPFFTTKEVGKGTGLGLATVYGIVKQHHGLVHVYSEPNVGTVFKVYLPVVERTADDADAVVDSPAIGGAETILVAEDEPMVLKLVANTLRAAGYTVLTAIDGHDAIRLFDEHRRHIDLVMLDVMMPGMSGREVMDQIMLRDPSAEFLFSSGYSQSAIHANFVINEGLRLIQKPYHGNSLQREVRRALDAHAARLASQKGNEN